MNAKEINSQVEKRIESIEIVIGYQTKTPEITSYKREANLPDFKIEFVVNKIKRAYEKGIYSKNYLPVTEVLVSNGFNFF